MSVKGWYDMGYNLKTHLALLLAQQRAELTFIMGKCLVPLRAQQILLPSTELEMTIAIA